MQTILLWIATLLVLIAMLNQSPKTLYIITGPPGAGKTTYAQTLGFPIYDTDLGNKGVWCSSKTHSVLTTSAPTAKIKEYWSKEAKKFGFEPVIVVMWLPRMEAYTRMKDRDGLSPTQRNDLEKDVERWYRQYTAHPREQRVSL